MNSSNTDKAAMDRIQKIIEKKKDMIKLSLSACVHCSICSDSCFKFTSNRKDPTYTPSYKAINSIGRIYKKKGNLSDEEYQAIKNLIWDKCVLCMRCYCPLGISIPSLIACARNVCREKGIYRTYDETDEGGQI
ncbi:MAG TPA: (Fe-S)-binding protein [Spirochaetota bacterium]|nr:(Fe-S)-binding protein [Spirochaetota bacterium]HPS87916.1 (Fe-S)-binding protein [Spirochaetota bacterium]